LIYIFAFSVPLNYLNLQMQEIGDGATPVNWSLVFSCVLIAVGAAITIEYVLRKRNIAALSPITVVLVTSSLLLWAFFGPQNKTLMYIFMYGGYFLFVATFYTRLGLICFSGEYPPFVLFAIGNFVNVFGLLSGTVIGIVAENLNSPGFAVVSILLTYALFFVGFIVMAKVSRKNLFADDGLPKGHQQYAAPTMVELISKTCAAAAKANNLTSRELEVLVYLVRGRSIQSIAEAIVLSQNTVKTHAHHIYQKFDAHTREELITAVERYASADKSDKSGADRSELLF
jgi:DNA-binding CsgD family transcriptional regulator